MKVDVLLGLQWGDEGKGKIVDVLAPGYDVVARFQGGPNAGHTLEFDGIKHVLHQIPSGIFRPSTRNVIGNGVVLDPIVFKAEIEKLQKYNLDVKANLFISKKATLIIPTHRLLDQAQENAKGENKIGSTLKGIGPSYQDKIGRQGLRVGDVLAENFSMKLHKLVDLHRDRCEVGQRGTATRPTQPAAARPAYLRDRNLQLPLPVLHARRCHAGGNSARCRAPARF